MRGFPIYLSMTLSILCCLSCSRVWSISESTPVQSVTEYEDTVYCFNQRSVVSLGEKKGLIDNEGREILATEWDSIEFLDDDVALLSRSGLWYLCTRDGRLFAEAPEPSDLESTFRSRYAEVTDKDSAYWDGVLDQLDNLREACVGSRSRRPDERVLQEFARLQELISKEHGGGMSRSQEERFERILSDFKSSYRK